MNESYDDSITYYIDEKLNDLRIDKAIALLNDSLSRTHIQDLIIEGNIILNNKTTKASTKVKTGDEMFEEKIYINDVINKMGHVFERFRYLTRTRPLNEDQMKVINYHLSEIIKVLNEN